MARAVGVEADLEKQVKSKDAYEGARSLLQAVLRKGAEDTKGKGIVHPWCVFSCWKLQVFLRLFNLNLFSLLISLDL